MSTVEEKPLVNRAVNSNGNQQTQEEDVSSKIRELPRTVSVDFQQPYKKFKQSADNESTATSVTSSVSTTSTTAAVAERVQNPFSGNYTNLLSEGNSCVLFATDEWFARAENLIKDSDPEFDPDLYCSEGELRLVVMTSLVYSPW